MSEELENSLQQSIETYVNDRLRGIDEQLSRLQSEFNEAFARLRESTATGRMEEPVSSAISAHLQAAREQKLSGASAPAPLPSEDFSVVKAAVEDIRNQQSQADVLVALLRNAAHFADRAALFVPKLDYLVGWRICRAQDPLKVDAVTDIALLSSGDTIVNNAFRSGSAETATGTGGENSGLIQQLGGEPQQLAAVPLVVRKRVVAVLYADSAWPHRDAIQLDVLDTLACVAGMAVELTATARVQPRANVSVAQAAPAPPEPEAAPVAPEPETAPESVYEAVQPAEPEPTTAEEPETATEPVMAEAEAAAPEPPAPVEAMPPPAEAPAPEFTPQYSAPLGSTRRWGVPEPELPIEVGEDERRLHNDARRFARLLVSEIKLYNEQKVSEGRSQGNIYDRLREDIDRSRQMYDKRVAPPVAARHDYFHQELVNTLAEGDPSKLGNSYPGTAVGVS
ncbi:MAG TPA: hypothetical protein VJT71_06510 [Pyrinomonadaceae bacterium]|nr:hypothetical protein [Pyrinomonadaceae bacterium]